MTDWSEDWEYDFSNPPRIPPPVYECDKCGQKSTEPMPVIVSKFVRNSEKDFHFCCRACHDEFYLNRMRGSGL